MYGSAQCPYCLVTKWLTLFEWGQNRQVKIQPHWPFASYVKNHLPPHIWGANEGFVTPLSPLNLICILSKLQKGPLGFDSICQCKIISYFCTSKKLFYPVSKSVKKWFPLIQIGLIILCILLFEEPSKLNKTFLFEPRNCCVLS